MFRKGQDGYAWNMTNRQLVERDMDEVQAMTRAGESVGKAVGTGLRAARLGAVRAGHAGADAATQLATKAEHKLAERGVTAGGIRGALAETAEALVEKAEEVEKSTRRTRKRLAKQRKQLAKKGGKARAELLSRAEEVRHEVSKAAANARKDAKVRAKDVRKAAKEARKQFAAETPKSRRRWPWIVGLLFAGAAAGYVVLTRRPQEVQLRDEEEETTTPPAPAPRDPVTSGTSEPSEPVESEHARNGHVADRQR
jgi:DNA segregation ATPase FtsK/SpoIIIE-like protein